MGHHYFEKRTMTFLKEIDPVNTLFSRNQTIFCGHLVQQMIGVNRDRALNQVEKLLCGHNTATHEKP